MLEPDLLLPHRIRLQHATGLTHAFRIDVPLQAIGSA